MWKKIAIIVWKKVIYNSYDHEKEDLQRGFSKTYLEPSRTSTLTTECSETFRNILWERLCWSIIVILLLPKKRTQHLTFFQSLETGKIDSFIKKPSCLLSRFKIFSQEISIAAMETVVCLCCCNFRWFFIDNFFYHQSANNPVCRILKVTTKSYIADNPKQSTKCKPLKIIHYIKTT